LDVAAVLDRNIWQAGLATRPPPEGTLLATETKTKTFNFNLGALFEDAAQRYPQLLIQFDHDLEIDATVGRELTVNSCVTLVSKIAAALRESGVSIGSRVVIYRGECFDTFLIACAVSRIGAIPALFSSTVEWPAAAVMLRRCNSPFLVVGAHELETMPNDVKASVASVLTVGSATQAGTALDLRCDPDPIPPHHIPLDQPALITHTSGTTGIPKLVVHARGTLGRRGVGAMFLLRNGERAAVHMPFVHSRFATAMTAAMTRGLQLFLIRDGQDLPSVGRILEFFRPSILEVLPNILIHWEPLTEDARGLFAELRVLSTTFDAAHPRTVLAFLKASRRRFAIHLQMYGQSEIGPVTWRVSTAGRGPESDWRCLGHPFPGYTRIRVSPRGGVHPSATSPGYIETRSGGRAIDYLGETERYAEQLSDGWWRMGDVGYRTRWGCVHLLDREIDMIEGVASTLTLEDTILSRIPDLREVVIVPGLEGDPVPVIVVRGDRPLDTVAWEECVRGLPALSAPVQVAENDLPQTGTAKVRRVALAKLLTGGR
jgi:acyl-coenzyme A synthetase/AMP-(fatty) acid ligase